MQKRYFSMNEEDCEVDVCFLSISRQDKRLIRTNNVVYLFKYDFGIFIKAKFFAF